MAKCPKSIDGLMRHLRSNGVAISGSTQKRKLRNMGYYHGYKGYRYIGRPSNRITFSDFAEIIALYNFDCQLKTLFYPYVMQIETALKNYVLEILAAQINSDNFNDIYNKLLDNHKHLSGKVYRDALRRRLKVRNTVYSVQTRAYENDNKIATHFYDKNTHLPIWAVFELLTLGEFGTFVSALNFNCRKNISREIGIRPSDDTSAELTQKIIFTIKELRNAIAHNNIIFDVRFKMSKNSRSIVNVIANVTNVQNINFDTIIDYLVLIIYILKNIKYTKTELKKIVIQFEEITQKLNSEIPFSVFSQIVQPDNKIKINALKKFISQ